MPELTADRTAVQWTAAGAEGDVLHFRLTRLLGGAWRLQAAVEAAQLDAPGAAQQLAEALDRMVGALAADGRA